LIPETRGSILEGAICYSYSEVDVDGRASVSEEGYYGVSNVVMLVAAGRRNIGRVVRHSTAMHCSHGH